MGAADESDPSPAEAAVAYKGLWRVEQAFRTLKTPLELRPIYHWTESRVRGHITVCFLAFTLRQILKKRLAERSHDGSFVELIERLSRVRAVLLDDGNGHRLRDEIPAAAMPAFQVLKIVPPRRVEQMTEPTREPTRVVPRAVCDLPTALRYDILDLGLSKPGLSVQRPP